MSNAKEHGALPELTPGNSGGIWTDRYRIGTYEADAKGRASLSGICRTLQETAWNHARGMAFGPDELMAQGRMWVLSRLLVEMVAFPGFVQRDEKGGWPGGVPGQDSVGRNGLSCGISVSDGTVNPQR